jgi:hypothetical protein
MLTEAVKTGYYQTRFGKYLKIRILTIDQLFAGKRLPSGFKKAAREEAVTVQERLF